MCEYLTGTTFLPTSRSAAPQLLRASFKRNQIMFMEKNDILNLYVVTTLPLPAGALPHEPDPWGADSAERPVK
jgi:hypothetical protein